MKYLVQAVRGKRERERGGERETKKKKNGGEGITDLEVPVVVV